MRPIDADALFINLDGMMAVSPTGYIHGDTVADMISDAPTIDAEPVRHGKWISNSPVTMRCNQCTYVASDWIVHEFHYCPNCGARMDEDNG